MSPVATQVWSESVGATWRQQLVVCPLHCAFKAVLMRVGRIGAGGALGRELMMRAAPRAATYLDVVVSEVSAWCVLGSLVQHATSVAAVEAISSCKAVCNPRNTSVQAIKKLSSPARHGILS